MPKLTNMALVSKAPAVEIHMQALHRGRFKRQNNKLPCSLPQKEVEHNLYAFVFWALLSFASKTRRLSPWCLVDPINQDQNRTSLTLSFQLQLSEAATHIPGIS